MTDNSTPSTAFARPIVEGNTSFAVDLYHQLRSAKGNLFFSPYSISTALAMTYGGARGETADQMAQVLHFMLDQENLHPAFASLEAHLHAVQEKGHIALHVANSLWPQVGYRFLSSYLELCRQYYGVSITSVDYAKDSEGARQRINAWVEDKTNDRIKDLLLPVHVTPVTTLILVNAIYFKGNWASQFDKGRTQEADFWIEPERSVPVPMMSQKLTCGYRQVDGLQILELPYVGEDLSMVLLLPEAVDGLAALEADLTTESLQRWTTRLRPGEVQVFLPRFKLTGAFELRDRLQAMGMIDAFDALDFSGMTGKRDLLIDDVIHKAFVDVNEEGTEAAAATAVIMARAVSMPSLLFRADHPFLFLIRDNATGSILFLGRLVDPAAGES